MSLNEKHLKQKSKNIIKNPNTTCQLVFSTMINNGWPLTFLYFEVLFFTIFNLSLFKLCCQTPTK